MPLHFSGTEAGPAGEPCGGSVPAGVARIGEGPVVLPAVISGLTVAAVVRQGAFPGAPACVTATLSSTSSPSIAALTGTVFAVEKATTTPPPLPPPHQSGYSMVGADGGVFSFGPGAHLEGSIPSGTHLNPPIVGMTTR